MDLKGGTANFIDWAPIQGRWELDGSTARYLGTRQDDEAAGVLLSPDTIVRGRLSTVVTFNGEATASQARILFGYQPLTGTYYTAGLGGYNRLLVVDEYTSFGQLTPVRVEGVPYAEDFGDTQTLTVSLAGHDVGLTMNKAKALEARLPRTLRSGGVGLFAWGPTPVKFEHFTLKRERPSAFVVMKFGGEYDTVYSQLIRPAAKALRLSVDRGDELPQPGLITEQVEQSISQASVVIAEVTPNNANIFYEVGFARAIHTPTVLLARAGRKLPFDVAGYRYIPYGKDEPGESVLALQESLKGALAASGDGPT